MHEDVALRIFQHQQIIHQGLKIGFPFGHDQLGWLGRNHDFGRVAGSDYFIAGLAVEAGMKYINITTRHHDSFCLFESKQTDFHSVNSPAKRDLVDDYVQVITEAGLAFWNSRSNRFLRALFTGIG